MLIGLGLAVTKAGIVPFAPDASVALDFQNNRYRLGINGAMASSFLGLTGATFTNSTGGYGIDASGNLISFPPNTPRITNQGILIEGASTNLLPQSNNPSLWGILSGVSFAQNAPSPDGLGSGWTVTQTGVNGSDSRAQQNISVANDNATYTATMFMPKAAVAPSVFPAFKLNAEVGTTPVRNTVAINPQTGAFLTSGPGGFRVDSVGAFWRIAITTTNNTTGNTALAVMFYPSYSATLSTIQATVQGGSAQTTFNQVEAAAFASSYIPTTSAAATRSADVASIGGVSLGAPMTLAAQGIVPATGGAATFPNIVQVDDGTNNNRAFAYVAGATLQANYGLTSGGTSQFSSSGAIQVVGQPYTVSARLNTSNQGFSVNGAAPGTSAAGAVPAMTTLRIGENIGGNFWGAPIAQMRIYPFAATDAQLQTISAGSF